MKTRKLGWNGKTFFYGVLVLVFAFFAFGCASQKLAERQAQISRMTDPELKNRYHEVVERLDDMDRDAEREKTREKEMQSPDGTDQREYPGDMHHMHIGDSWQQLRHEKKMLYREMKKRGIDPDVSARRF